MDQTRYTLVGIFISALLAISAGILAQWYAAGARPTITGANETRLMVEQTAMAVTRQAELLPTPIPASSDSASNLVEPTKSFYDSLLDRAYGWPLVAFDSFDDNARGWGTGTASNRASGYRAVENGQLVWDLVGLESLTWTDGTVGAPFDEFMVSVEVERDSAEIGAYSLIFRQEDVNNLFQFGICPGNTRFEIWRNQDGEWTNPVKCTEHSAIRPDGSNKLTVVALNNSYVFYVNQTLVDTLDDDAFSNGLVGVAVDLDADQTNIFKFDNFELRAPLKQ